MLGLVTPLRSIGGPGPFLSARSWSLQAQLPPEPLHSLWVHLTAISQQQPVGHPPSPTDVLGRDLAETPPELGLLNVDNLAALALGTAVQNHHSKGANRSEIPNMACRVLTALQDRSELRSFPQPTPTAAQKPSIRASPSRAQPPPEAF